MAPWAKRQSWHREAESNSLLEKLVYSLMKTALATSLPSLKTELASPRGDMQTALSTHSPSGIFTQLLHQIRKSSRSAQPAKLDVSHRRILLMKCSPLTHKEQSWFSGLMSNFNTGCNDHHPVR